jgi:drug/metabolite transporter (DMT)-like permease
LKKVINNIDKGVLYMLLASLFFAIVGAFAKLLSREMPSVEVVFFRNIISLLFVISTIFKYPIKQGGGKPWLLFFRGLMGLLGVLAFFYNIAHISLADAMTFSRTSPIWTAVFAYMFLGEKISKRGVVAIFIGFMGVVFIMKPNGLTFSKTDIIGILSGVLAALAYTSVRELRKYYDARVIVISFMLMGSLFPALFMWISNYYDVPSLDFVVAPFVLPHGISWLYIIALGGFAALAQVYMTKAYGNTKAGIVGASSYAVILFSIFVGISLGDSLPDVMGAFGIMLVIIGGILIAKGK